MSASILTRRGDRERFAGAVEQISWEQNKRFLARLGRLRIDTCIKTIDQLLEDLELRNLAGMKTVPPEWQARLDRLQRSLPFSPSEQLCAGVKTVVLMDRLFDVQGKLLVLKRGRSPEMDRADAAIDQEICG